MNGWSKEDLEEMFGDDIIGQMAFVSGCYRHILSNADPSGWIISDEDLRKFAELIVRECARAVDRVYETAPADYGCLDWSAAVDGSDVLKHFGIEQ